ncbi:DUF3662 domain-containing protein [Streptomyces sp. NPDC057636]|uniref:DUF3662 domain-containing protein n=1 Tax=Streptomyces sp. NPDC057636 TaxID=3346189 RepID=UPI0036B59304
MAAHDPDEAGQPSAMGKMGNVERVMEKWAADLVDRVFRPKRESVEVVSTLRRECDDNIMILGRGRTLVPNAFTVALPQEIHRELGSHAHQLGPVLATKVRDHAASHSYVFAGPVTVTLEPDPTVDTGGYRIQSSIVPARTGPRPTAG